MRRRIFAVALVVAAVLGGVALVGGTQQQAAKIEPKADHIFGGDQGPST